MIWPVPIDSVQPAIDILVKAEELINTHGWIQGKYGSDELGYCASGAITAAATDFHISDNETFRYLSIAEIALEKVIRKTGTQKGIVRYNDAPGRTVSEIIERFHEAVAYLESHEAGAYLESYNATP